MALPAVSPIGTELLDDPAADPAVVERMLGDIARANRWFGGTRTVTRGLTALLDDRDRGTTLTLLDIGTGAGDLPLAAMRWANTRGVTLVPLGVERHRAAARLAAANGVATVVACGTRLPFAVPLPRSAPEGAARHGTPLRSRVEDAARDGTPLHPSPFTLHPTVDIVLLSQLLHHFDDEAAVALLAAAHAVARRGVIVADLRPSRAAAAMFRAAGRALGFARVTIDDGATSLARGRDASTVASLVRRAGATPQLVADLPMARVLVAWRSAP